ncbi:MAG: DUF1800 domain-containing protein [Pseudomonadota bacterium]|nr:DUF1800 domain-containing protein [Pseudomonadota bacterium]
MATARNALALALLSSATLLCAALAPTATASPSDLLDYDDARHLLNRAGFGATQAEIERTVGMTRDQAARSLVDGARTNPVNPPPAWTAETESLRYPRPGEASDAEKKMFQQEQIRRGLELRGWWVGEMLATSSPLTERMTLFWHNHFVSSQQKVRLAVLMYRQNATLRANALGNFGDLLHAVARDPAMVIYLDSAQNRKGSPNENFAREVMELFTLGEGQYGEQDIKEAARAFTGWSLDRTTGQFVFRRFIHDDGVKTVLGKSGNLDGDQVVDILLAQPATAEFITRKLWREFVSPDPDDNAVRRIAQRFRESRYEIKVALRELFTSDAFYVKENRAALIKSPVELVVGTLRQFGMKPGEATPFAVAAAGMGQNLFSPPNVKGWPGQATWINASTLLARKQFLERLFRGDEAPGRMLPGGGAQSMVADAAMYGPMPTQAVQAQGALDPDKARQVRFMRAMERGISNISFQSDVWLAQFDASRGTSSRGGAAARLLLATAPQSPQDASEPLALVRALVLDASYQLK